MTSGFLLSATIPASSSISERVSKRPGFNRTLSCVPLAEGSEGVMIRKAGESEELVDKRRCSR